MTFQPDYRHILDAAQNREASRLPLYEHIISSEKIEDIIGRKFTAYYQGDDRDLDEYFRHYCGFFRDYGYDTVSFEASLGFTLPGNGALGNPSMTPVIQTMDDFRAYPWDELCDHYFEEHDRYLKALRRNMPEGMKAIGGVGNGVFECVQTLTGYQNLCYISADDEELYTGLFEKIGELERKVCSRFMKEYGDIFCVLRFGDDLGFKNNTLLSPDDIKTLILPHYKNVIDTVHSHGKPFLLHSCGCIFKIMDDLIACGIDAKHSNEDQIAPFSTWIETYGDKIGNFGGIDMNVLCTLTKPELKEYITPILENSSGHGGIAIGTGNSIPDYIPTENYLYMLELVREFRGDFAK